MEHILDWNCKNPCCTQNQEPKPKKFIIDLDWGQRVDFDLRKNLNQSWSFSIVLWSTYEYVGAFLVKQKEKLKWQPPELEIHLESIKYLNNIQVLASLQACHSTQ